jgi:hypothetical protein
LLVEISSMVKCAYGNRCKIKIGKNDRRFKPKFRISTELFLKSVIANFDHKVGIGIRAKAGAGLVHH